MSEKYTKGSWFIENVGEEPLHVTSASRDGFIPVCIVQTGYEGQIEVEQQANARLLASAPELLEALKPFAAFLDALEHMGGRPKSGVVYAIYNHIGGHREIAIEDFQKARAAILKATGEQA